MSRNLEIDFIAVLKTFDILDRYDPIIFTPAVMEIGWDRHSREVQLDRHSREVKLDEKKTRGEYLVLE